MHDVCLQLFLRDKLLTREAGEVFLTTLAEHLPKQVPQFVSHAEPIRHKVGGDWLADAIDYWEDGLLWRGRDGSLGQVMLGRTAPDYPTVVSITSGLKGFDALAALSFLRACGERLGVVLGLLHLVNDGDVEDEWSLGTYGSLDSAGKRRFLSVNHWMLNRYLPNLYWGMLFGSEYLSLFGRERLLSSPAFRVEAAGGEHLLLQLTGDIRDCRDDHEGVQAVRAAVKQHLGEGAFADLTLNEYQQRRVPLLPWGSGGSRAGGEGAAAFRALLHPSVPRPSGRAVTRVAQVVFYQGQAVVNPAYPYRRGAEPERGVVEGPPYLTVPDAGDAAALGAAVRQALALSMPLPEEAAPLLQDKQVLWPRERHVALGVRERSFLREAVGCRVADREGRLVVKGMPVDAVELRCDWAGATEASLSTGDKELGELVRGRARV